MQYARIPALALLLSTVSLAGAASALQSSGESTFHRAFFLEHSEHDYAAARELYGAVADRADAPPELRRRAREAVADLDEELVAQDLARLMPADSLFYAEIERPGEKLAGLLGELGLLAGRRPGEKLGLSPLLLRVLLGMRGAAVAVTHFDLQRGEPAGVLVVHPGDVDLLRGLVDTVVPAGGLPADPIGGHPTWSLEGRAVLTLTRRLVVVARTRGEIEGVVRRLADGGRDSLAGDPVFTQGLPRRGALLSFCFNAKPVLPLVKALVAARAQHDPELQMALGMVDIDSLRTLSGHLDVGGDGLELELAFQLDEDHRNLVFNLLRMPHVDPATLALVPRGAAFFYAAALNPSGGAPPLLTDGRGRPIVTLVDFGREVFGNLADFAVYGLPSGATDATGATGAGIPDVAAILRVNSPERSRELWRFVLALASQATGGAGEPDPAEIAGLAVDEFEIQGLPVFLAVDGKRLIVSPSEAAIARSLEAGAGRGSVADDPVYRSTLAALARADQGATWFAMADLGRCAALARPFAPPSEARRMQVFEELLADTVLAVGVEHSDTRIAWRARVVGVPDVSPFVRPWIDARRRHGEREAVVRAGVLEGVFRGTDDPLARFSDLARSDPERARSFGEEIALASDDAEWLNRFAWALLTEERFGGRFDDLALLASSRSNELSDHGNWYHLDTLALAVARQGLLDKAIELEELAVELADAAGDARVPREALERYRRELAGDR